MESFKQRLRRGDTLIGTILTLPSPEVAEMLSDMGFDWLFVDTEHTPLDTHSVLAILQAAGSRCPCVVRVAEGDEVSIKKTLDLGPAGIIVPHINSSDDAERVVRWCHFPPRGGRSIGVSRANGYGLKLQEYIARAGETLALVLQIEHIDAVRNIEAILAVPGFDGVFIGPFDLSASMGMVGQVGAPEVQHQIAVVREACVKAGLPVGIFAVGGQEARSLVAQGYTLMAAGTDTLLLATSARDLLSTARG